MPGQLYRYRVQWLGAIGGPGISTFYLDPGGDVPGWMTALHTLFNGLKNDVPPNIVWHFPSSADVINIDDGSLASAMTVTPPADVGGNGGGAYAAPTGMEIQWLTNGVVHSHRVRGRTFVVPTMSFDDTTGGVPAAGAISDFNTAAAAYIAGVNAHGMVYSRPFKGTPPTPTRPANPARLGTAWFINGYNVPPKFVVLRGRRDT